MIIYYGCKNGSRKNNDKLINHKHTKKIENKNKNSSCLQNQKILLDVDLLLSISGIVNI